MPLQLLPIATLEFFSIVRFSTASQNKIYLDTQKFAKVMFLQVSVCPRGWGGGPCVVAPGGGCWGAGCSFGVGVCGCSGACVINKNFLNWTLNSCFRHVLETHCRFISLQSLFSFLRSGVSPNLSCWLDKVRYRVLYEVFDKR